VAIVSGENQDVRKVKKNKKLSPFHAVLDNMTMKWYILFTLFPNTILNSDFAQSKPGETQGRRAAKLNKTALPAHSHDGLPSE
jgi:hypothetical protein